MVRVLDVRCFLIFEFDAGPVRFGQNLDLREGERDWQINSNV